MMQYRTANAAKKHDPISASLFLVCDFIGENIRFTLCCVNLFLGKVFD